MASLLALPHWSQDGHQDPLLSEILSKRLHKSERSPQGTQDKLLNRTYLSQFHLLEEKVLVRCKLGGLKVITCHWEFLHLWWIVSILQYLLYFSCMVWVLHNNWIWTWIMQHRLWIYYHNARSTIYRLSICAGHISMAVMSMFQVGEDAGILSRACQEHQFRFQALHIRKTFLSLSWSCSPQIHSYKSFYHYFILLNSSK